MGRRPGANPRHHRNKFQQGLMWNANRALGQTFAQKVASHRLLFRKARIETVD
jgi:hypothetical protein